MNDSSRWSTIYIAFFCVLGFLIGLWFAPALLTPRIIEVPGPTQFVEITKFEPPVVVAGETTHHALVG